MINKVMSKVEKLAHKLVKKNNLTPPIDIVNFIKKYADVEEADIPFSIDALCHQGPGKPKIILQEEQPLFRKRFTYAHELGHLVIPWHIGTLSCNVDEKSDLVDNDTFFSIESEANSFAAEFLAPSNWIEEMIRKNDKLNLTELFNLISSTAEISLQASIFSVSKHLDKKYLILYQDIEKDLTRKLSTEDNDIFVPYINNNYIDSSYDINWLDKSSIKHDIIKRANYKVYWWDFNYEGKDNETKKLIKRYEKNGLTVMIGELARMLNVPLIVSFYKLLKLLPEVYVIYVCGKDYCRCFMSPNTKLKYNRNYSKGTYDAEWLDKYSQEFGNVDIDGYMLNWWRFNTDIEDINNIDDDRDSKQILSDILNETYSENDIKVVKCRINGIVGGCNSVDGSNSVIAFTKFLKQRFIGREDLIDFIEHSDFNIFIAKKAYEIFNKRKNGK